MSDEFRYYDKIDRDVIQVNKDTLLLRISEVKDFSSATGSMWGWFSAALSFLLTALFAGNVSPVFGISGSAIRGAAFSWGLITLFLAGRSAYIWWKKQSNFTPESVVDGLRTTSAPRHMPLLLEAPKQQHSLVPEPSKIARARSKRPASVGN